MPLIPQPYKNIIKFFLATLKNVDETIAGIIRSIENGFDIPPVIYNKKLS